MTLCVTFWSFSQVTVVPDATDRVVGEKVVLNKQNVLPGQLGPVELPPQDAIPIARNRAPNEPDILRIQPPRIIQRRARRSDSAQPAK
jgi:hypothetical protein